MDKWLGSIAKVVDMVEAPTEAPKVSADGKKELRFGQGQLGFEIECMHVISVAKESQAARHGVAIGDRLTKVDGRAVPEFEPDDTEGEQHAHERVSQWLENMPRPAFISFESPVRGASAAQDVDGGPSPSPDISEAPSSDAEADFNRNMGLVQEAVAEGVLQEDDMSSQRDLVVELKRQRGVNVQLTENLREQQRKVGSLWKQLAVLKAENKQILLVQSRAQEESFDAIDVAQNREKALKDEMAQMRFVADGCNRAAAEDARKEMEKHIGAAESRAAAAEAMLETLQRQLAGFHAEHETELRMSREKQEQWEKDACVRFAEQDRKHKEKELESARLLAQAKAESSGDFDFSSELNQSSVPARSHGDTKAVAALYDRIDILQRRCGAMQKKLSSVSSQGFTAGIEVAPSWAPRLISILGLRAGEPLLRIYMMVSVAMLRVTHLLLQREMWRWIFYAHIVILYTIAASWWAQKITDPVNPIDVINAGIEKAVVANAKGLDR